MTSSPFYLKIIWVQNKNIVYNIFYKIFDILLKIYEYFYQILVEVDFFSECEWHIWLSSENDFESYSIKGFFIYWLAILINFKIICVLNIIVYDIFCINFWRILIENIKSFPQIFPPTLQISKSYYFKLKVSIKVASSEYERNILLSSENDF